MQKFPQQIISSTHVDAHGEKMELDLLRDFAETINNSGRFPIGQQHDANKGYAGYMENAFIEKDLENSGEHFLKADIYCDEEDLEILLGGFSFSVNIGIKSNTEEPLFGVYLPYPHYNNENSLNKVLEIDEPIKVGKWLKKSADPATVALITSFIVLFLGPFWKQVYDEKIAPHVKKILNSDNIDKSLKRDFAIQVRDKSDNDFSIYFSSDKKQLRSLDPYIIKAGIQKVFDFLESDIKARKTGLSQVRLNYNTAKRNYSIFSVTYRDGEYQNNIS